MVDPRAASTASAAPAPLRGRLAQLSPVQADVLRDLHRRPRRWTTATGTVQLRAIARGNDAGLFELDADGVRIGVRLAAPPASAGGEDALRWQDRSGRARLLAWAVEHETVLVRLGEALGTALRPVAETCAADASAMWLAFELHPGSGEAGDVWSGTLRAPVAWVAALVARSTGPGHPVALGPWRQWPAPVRLALAAPALTMAELRSLRPGDVIVVGTPRNPPLHATVAGLRWPLRHTPDGARIDGPPASSPRHLETVSMAEPDSDTTGTDAPAVPEDPAARLPVEVEFELGRLDLPLGEVAALQPGYVFALPLHLEGTNVTIRANGRVAGQGELVAVGETLGVRLVAWS
ncbi:type III secretion system cytoplasmic ring protein SctQ [Luteimonas deserti]|uniref:Type III secretion system cytoplasmic ring protein SctQ n=1 Tax=Luteimonas deserti TaxID=2752306 RepID=A0A7Z0TTS4_9GAMM|nr:type III secretion system cytoplasmic ring protein SctQ [Luteimonas deserti]NYZ62091.1 type III secretion system cytoplasmic ring protein SctQ [Luteimonas deserti]